MQSPNNNPFTTEEDARAIERHIQEQCPHVITTIRHDKFEPHHWFVDVKWPQHLQLVIRSEKSWHDRQKLFALEPVQD